MNIQVCSHPNQSSQLQYTQKNKAKVFSLIYV